jgi:hypothetical protein
MATAEATLPEGFRLRRASGTLRISWRGPTHWIFVIVGAILMLVSGGWLASAISKSYGFYGASLVAGAGLLVSTYAMLVGACNHASIGICEGRLEAQHGPLPCLLPFLFNVSCGQGIPVNEIAELRVEPEGEPDPMTGRLPTYALQVARHNGTVETVLTRMELEDARPLGKILAEATGSRVVLPEAEQPRICVRRLRHP